MIKFWKVRFAFVSLLDHYRLKGMITVKDIQKASHRAETIHASDGEHLVTSRIALIEFA
jgi:hypothetical protein